MTEPIRILHMIGSLNLGGSQSMVINLHKAIDKSKVQFDYVVDHPNHLYFADIVKNLGGKIYTMPTFKGFNYFEVRSAWNIFFKQHPEYKILHSHVRSYASLYLPIAKRAGLKTIVHSHNTSNGKGVTSIAKHILQYPLRYLSDYYFACSKKAGVWLFGEKKVECDRFHILPNAVDVRNFAYSDERRNEIRNELNLGNKIVYGNIGRLTKQKNQDFLIDVFSGVYKKNNNSTLLIVGSGELEYSLKEKVTALGLKESVVFTGARADVAALLSAIDVFVFPSLWEGLPVTVIEAQAAGLPCFVSSEITDEVGLSDLVHYLPINQGPQLWIDALYGKKFCRKEVAQEIKNAGYDIQYTIQFLMDFYKNIL